MPSSFIKWRNHKNVYCVDCYLPSTRFVFSGDKIISCLFPDGQTISVGDQVEGKTVKAIEKHSVSLMLVTE